MTAGPDTPSVSEARDGPISRASPVCLTQSERGCHLAGSGSPDVREAGPPLYLAPEERCGCGRACSQTACLAPQRHRSDPAVLVCGEPLTILRFVTSPSNYMVGSPRGGIASYTSREIPQSIQHNSENRDV